MSKSYRRRAASAALATLTSIVLASSMTTPASAVEGSAQGEPTAQGLGSQVPPEVKVSQDLRTRTGQVSVFVQFEGAGAFERTQPQSVRSGLAAPVRKVAEVQNIRGEIEAKAEDVAAEASATSLYTTTNTIPGVAMTGDAEQIRALAARPDVKKITGIVPKTLDNKGGVIDTRALESWVQRDQTGDGVTIAVLDTGLDYTHAGFGGPGTIEAFNTAKASATIPEESLGLYDPAKFIGGFDLVGDAYDPDPASDTYSPVPVPDANPLDCQGHGSHVAGTAAGYGVNADGSTFKGDYTSLTAAEVNAMRIGPGSAPKAGLVSLRVFGCEGTSEVVGLALDYVLDPNRDGDFSDRANVVNMSLGSDFPAYDDPEIDIVNSLTAQGVLSVVSSGNGGDVFDNGGSPGSAASALTVANSVGSQVTLDGIDVLAPADVAGRAAGQYSANFDYTSATEEQLTGEVVVGPAANRFGCNPFEAGSLEGKWVWLQWEENGAFPCGSGVRFNNAEAAGAEGVILDSPRSVFEAGIAGNATIPGVQFNARFSQSLRAAAEDGTLQVRLDPDLQGTAVGASDALDTLSPSSSRGVHGSNGVVKPDVAAPGTSIGSVQSGSGTLASAQTGTSMAAPRVAGIAALLVGATDYNPYQIKSVIMNTATHDILTADGVIHAPNRTGSGRVDALNALDARSLAYATADPALTTVSFGVLELAADPVSLTRQITVENRSDTVVAYTAEYLEATAMPGVEISVTATGTSSATADVPANGRATFDVVLSIADPTALAKSIDPAAERFQQEVPRQYIADASGRVQFTSTTASTLRVPVHAAPKPTADLTAGTNIPFDTPSDLESDLTFTGRGLLQGGEDSLYASIASPFVLGTESARRESLALESLYALDLKSVGASSTVPGLVKAGGDPLAGYLSFGISTWANWNTLSSAPQIQIEIDADNNDEADFIAATGRAEELDLVLVNLYAVSDDGTISAEPVDGGIANNVFGDVDTNLLDTNVVTLPLPVAKMGLNLAAGADISYRVSTSSQYSVDAEGQNVPVDTTDWIDFSVSEPAFWFEGDSADTSFIVTDGSSLRVHRTAGNTTSKGLFLHHHNASGARDEVLAIQQGRLRFPDTAGNQHEAAINWLADAGLTTGYPDGTYRPLGSVNRDAMAAFLYRLAGEPAYAAPSTSPFKDITPNTKFYKEMSWLAETGITTGYSDDTYRPLAPVNRDAMAAFMNRFAGEFCNIADAGNYTNPSTASFRDVPVNLQFAREISWMKASAISTGWADGTYRPVAPVARDAMAAFIQRLDSYETDNGGCKP
ncbi:S8 family serine peptidase [Arthrobacter burdickii]|uniref:S8 family serine peptidase n=1 Tax=Arthrobacter burdickii TaxID=3035920 RepID=A0ABT8K581_9MICC|nr:S8 family serine peptidase [Arthrobacter burdickii]MDN4612618.1 S8 family serine peptidase [Arthrobacter burdickii]